MSCHTYVAICFGLNFVVNGSALIQLRFAMPICMYMGTCMCGTSRYHGLDMQKMSCTNCTFHGIFWFGVNCFYSSCIILYAMPAGNENV